MCGQHERCPFIDADIYSFSVHPVLKLPQRHFRDVELESLGLNHGSLRVMSLTAEPLSPCSSVDSAVHSCARLRVHAGPGMPFYSGRTARTEGGRDHSVDAKVMGACHWPSPWVRWFT